MNAPLRTHITIRHAHLFCGLGGGAKGFNRGRANVGSVHARFECVGGIDIDAACIRDFERLAGARGTVLDLFDREQYVAFHGKQPPEDWRETGPSDILAAFGPLTPHILFLSPPCKGLSGLLSENKSRSGKYQALNRLTVRGVWLALEAYRDDPVPLIILENVPRIASRGRRLLDLITQLLKTYGYRVAETTHDCGELGGLAQSRKRFLLVARHMEKVPSFLYEPYKRPLKAVGDILSRMPRPGDPLAGPMHRIPRLQWKTWVRLAFVEAGSDWRSLKKLAVENGYLRDYGIIPEQLGPWRDDVLGVLGWDDTSGTLTGKSSPTNGRYAVADPAPRGQVFGKYAVTPYAAPAGTVISGSTTGQGAYAVADPNCGGIRHNNVFRIVSHAAPSGAVTAGAGPSAGGQAVADPNTGYGKNAHHSVFRVVDWQGHTGAITGAAHVTGSAPSVADPNTGWSREACGHSREGAYGVVSWSDPSGPVTAKGRYDNSRYAVADPTPGLSRGKGDNYLTAGQYGVRRYNEACGAVSASACHDNGFFSVADPDVTMPKSSEQLVCMIIARDGTWHRPFTTLELAALQGLMNPEEQLELDGLSDSAWRERIGNAVPPPAAAAIAGVMGEVLILTALGETFSMSAQPVWVRPIAAALMAATGGM